MGKPFPPEPALLFVGALYRHEEYLSLAREHLRKSFGDILFESIPLPWDYSPYYRDELGWPVKRTFIFFRERISPERLSDIKLLSNGIEQRLATEGKRNINLDPGYLTLYNVVLASTKNYAHRIYLGKGIFAEVTLVYRDGMYRPHLFTYRDYAGDTYAELFGQARNLLAIP